MRDGIRQRRGDAGHSLLELMVVLTIISLLAAIAAPHFASQVDRAPTEQATRRLADLREGLASFQFDVGRLPTEAEGLRALIEPPSDAVGWRGPYLATPSTLIDPWGAPYQFQDDDGAGVVVFSYGADGVAGGDGSASDLRSVVR